jgi:hypothetical protein
MYEKRWENAVRIAHKINDSLDKGYLVFNSENALLDGKFRVDDEGVFLPLGEHCQLMYFVNDIELDNGYYTTIKRYNEQFKGWRYVKPENVKKLRI